MDVKVSEWVTVADIPEGSECSVGELGGWVDGEKWPEYIAGAADGAVPYLEAIRSAVVKDKLRITGEQHQHYEWTPVFSDGTHGGFSYRAWGDMMAAIWNTEEDTEEYSYMSFYM
jgi:hypothetical protein